MNDWLTLTEASKLLGHNSGTLYNWCLYGIIDSLQMQSGLHVPSYEIQRILTNKRDLRANGINPNSHNHHQTISMKPAAKDANGEPPYLYSQEVAARLGVDRRSVYGLIEAGVLKVLNPCLPSQKGGQGGSRQTYLIDRASFNALLASKQAPPWPAPGLPGEP